jgi:hypothetical protein
MSEEYPRREFTVRLKYIATVSSEKDEEITVVADDEEGAIDAAWVELYKRNDYDGGEIEEDDATITKDVIVERGDGDDQTLQLFSNERKDNGG